MQLGMIGLGRMGSAMVQRLLRAGHSCVAYDRRPEAITRLAATGAESAATLGALVDQLSPPRTIWLMLPAAAVDGELEAIKGMLKAGDTLIDGGNSYYRDDLRRAQELSALGLHYVDVGTSGGIAGEARGFCLMIGGEADVVASLAPIFAALAPGFDAAPRTPGRTGNVAEAEQGFLHCGPAGAGHFVKMVHNGIEYGIMAAYAEGLAILRAANVGNEPSASDAETSPLREPEYYRFDMNLPNITEVWRRGSVIGSWLLDLTAGALLRDPQLAAYEGHVADSGEGRWTLQAAIDEGIPAQVLSAALYERFASRGDADFANRALSAMRHEFGGHVETGEEK